MREDSQKPDVPGELILMAQMERDEKDKRTYVAGSSLESNRIKANQTKSNLRGGPGQG
jgi:hypothetical protein